MKKIIALTPFLFFISILVSPGKSYAQQADNFGGEVLQLEEIKVEVKIEEPRVAITKVRKKPEFDHVELEKDFKPELLAILKSVTYASITSGKVEKIPDIEVLVNIQRKLD